MSRDELSRMVGDVMDCPTMIREAAAIRDRETMETYIESKGYDLTRDEILEVWSMTAKVMAGHSEPMDTARSRIEEARAGLEKQQ